MNNKLLCIILTVVMTGLILTGCKKAVGTPEDNPVVKADEESETDEEIPSELLEGEGHLFGYSCVDSAQPYFYVLKEAMRMFLEDNEARLLFKDAKGDAELQNEQIQELIDANVDAVFLTPMDWAAITPALEALKEAGIPVINLETQVRQTDLVNAYIGSNNKQAGRLCGDDLKKRKPKGGKVIIFESSSINAVNERITGFEESIANAGFEVSARRSVEINRQSAQQAARQVLEQHKDADAIMCGNDEIALGVLAAAKEAGITNLLIYGVDGSPDIKQELAKADTLIAGSAARLPIRTAEEAVLTGLAILEDKEYEKEIFTGAYMLDRSNIKLYGTDGWQ